MLNKLTFLTWLVLICFSPISQSYGIDHTLLVGEWAEVGKCNISRVVYTKDGKYKWLKRNNRSEWELLYEGIYIPVAEKNRKSKGIKEKGAVIVADGFNQEGYFLQLEIISFSRLKGYWDVTLSPDLSFDKKDALFDYVRCGKL